MYPLLLLELFVTSVMNANREKSSVAGVESSPAAMWDGINAVNTVNNNKFAYLQYICMWSVEVKELNCQDELSER
jgi:hypothetical protein